MKLIWIIGALFLGGLLVLSSCGISERVEPTPAAFSNVEKTDVRLISHPINTPAFIPDSPKLPSQAAPVRIVETDVVYVTEKSAAYHRAGCRSLWESQIVIERSEAIKQGYTPCPICLP
jgi:hypothetical protein